MLTCGACARTDTVERNASRNARPTRRLLPRRSVTARVLATRVVNWKGPACARRVSAASGVMTVLYRPQEHLILETAPPIKIYSARYVLGTARAKGTAPAPAAKLGMAPAPALLAGPTLRMGAATHSFPVLQATAFHIQVPIDVTSVSMASSAPGQQVHARIAPEGHMLTPPACRLAPNAQP